MKKRLATLVLALGASAFLAGCMPMHHNRGGDCPGPQRDCPQHKRCCKQCPPAGERPCDKQGPAEKPQQ